MERHHAAGVIVFVRGPNGCRFLLLRSRLTRRPIWEFAKGGIDPGESTETAALRELAEEAGYDARQVTLLPGFERVEDYRFTTERDGRRLHVRKRVTYFLAEAPHTDVRIAAAEASDYAWLPLAEALRRVRYARRREILADAARHAGCTDARAAQSEATLRSREASAGSGRDST